VILLCLTEFILETIELFNVGNISAEDVTFLLLKQTYKSLLFISQTQDVLCQAGSDTPVPAH